MFRNYLNRNVTETELELKNSIEEFIKIDNKEKFKNIFNHSCIVIKQDFRKNPSTYFISYNTKNKIFIP